MNSLHRLHAYPPLLNESCRSRVAFPVALHEIVHHGGASNAIHVFRYYEELYVTIHRLLYFRTHLLTELQPFLVEVFFVGKALDYGGVLLVHVGESGATHRFQILLEGRVFRLVPQHENPIDPYGLHLLPLYALRARILTHQQLKLLLVLGLCAQVFAFHEDVGVEG